MAARQLARMWRAQPASRRSATWSVGKSEVLPGEARRPVPPIPPDGSSGKSASDQHQSPSVPEWLTDWTPGRRRHDSLVRAKTQAAAFSSEAVDFPLDLRSDACRCRVQDALDLQKAGREPSSRSPKCCVLCSSPTSDIWTFPQVSSVAAGLWSANGQHQPLGLLTEAQQPGGRACCWRRGLVGTPDGLSARCSPTSLRRRLALPAGDTGVVVHSMTRVWSEAAATSFLPFRGRERYFRSIPISRFLASAQCRWSRGSGTWPSLT